MKIWIDITNAPHVNFFRPFINNWSNRGFNIVVTTRPLSNTLPLLDLYGIDYHVVGGHAGKSSYKKVLNFATRVIKLMYFIKKHHVDIGISQSSFYSPVAGRMMGIPVIYTNDNEHAAGNSIAFRFSTMNILPEALITYSKKFNAKFSFYPGVKESIYLGELMNTRDRCSNFKRHQLKIFMRLEPETAQYYTSDESAFDDCVNFLSLHYNLTILPRSESQYNYYSEKFPATNVSIKSISLEDIVSEADLFIGAGGSMTREFAVLGIPTVSVYRGDLLEVDKFLIKRGSLVHSALNVAELKSAIAMAQNLFPDSMDKEGRAARELVTTELTKILSYSNP